MIVVAFSDFISKWGGTNMNERGQRWSNRTEPGSIGREKLWKTVDDAIIDRIELLELKY